jgi:Domain of unknown function (DUF1918)
MSAKVGDLVVAEAERTSQTARRGVIEEVLQEQPPCFRVHWDDGHESIFSPAAGSLRVEPEQKRGRKAPARARASRR